jgi:hypothetical protein
LKRKHSGAGAITLAGISAARVGSRLIAYLCLLGIAAAIVSLPIQADTGPPQVLVPLSATAVPIGSQYQASEMDRCLPHPELGKDWHGFEPIPPRRGPSVFEPPAQEARFPAVIVVATGPLMALALAGRAPPGA